MLKRSLKCSFCRRPDTEVAKLVAGPRVYICDRCAAIAVDLMNTPEPPAEPLTVVRHGLLSRVVAAARRLASGGDTTRRMSERLSW